MSSFDDYADDLNVEAFRIPKFRVPKIPKIKVPKIRPSNGRMSSLLRNGASFSTIAANLASLGINIYSAVGQAQMN
jgi:hypothetical protein